MLVATISSTGAPAVVTSALAGVLTPVTTSPGPPGDTFALSTVSLYWYPWTGAPDTISLSGIPGGGVVIASVASIPGPSGPILTWSQSAGVAEPMTLPIGASAVGATIYAGQLYGTSNSLQGWVAPFAATSGSTPVDTLVNYDGIDYSLDTGFYVTPTGLAIVADDAGTGPTAWGAVGGAWV